MWLSSTYIISWTVRKTTVSPGVAKVLIEELLVGGMLRLARVVLCAQCIGSGPFLLPTATATDGHNNRHCKGNNNWHSNCFNCSYRSSWHCNRFSYLGQLEHSEQEPLEPLQELWQLLWPCPHLLWEQSNKSTPVGLHTLLSVMLNVTALKLHSFRWC